MKPLKYGIVHRCSKELFCLELVVWLLGRIVEFLVLPQWVFTLSSRYQEEIYFLSPSHSPPHTNGSATHLKCSCSCSFHPSAFLISNRKKSSPAFKSIYVENINILDISPIVYHMIAVQCSVVC